MVCELLETIGNRRYTLPGLSRRLEQDKPLLCMYLSELHGMGIVEKRVIKRRMRYSVRARRVLRLVRKAREIARELESGTAPAPRPRVLPPREEGPVERRTPGIPTLS
ncbi:MAG: hypothetical protein MUC63_09855 [Planctomycetes bacterium]|nr:hypothetical protein [Planctomycetota bacterium]